MRLPPAAGAHGIGASRRVVTTAPGGMRFTSGMPTPDSPDDERDIADTGMFRRFVEHEAEMDQVEPTAAPKGRWIAITAIIAIIVIAAAVWALTR